MVPSLKYNGCAPFYASQGNLYTPLIISQPVAPRQGDEEGAACPFWRELCARIGITSVTEPVLSRNHTEIDAELFWRKGDF